MFSHMGICVSDAVKSVKFYCEALGFEERWHRMLGNELSALVGIEPELAFEVHIVVKDGFVIELIHFFRPDNVGSSTAKPMNQLGFTHLSFRVEDIDAMAARIEALGGKVLRSTRTAALGGDVIFCTDPDGTRIELMRLPDEVPTIANWASSDD
jgi:glyoxylase I family protein